MSADIWLEDEDGEQIVIPGDVGIASNALGLADPDRAMRSLVPMRSPASVDSTTFNLTYNLTPMLREAGMPPWKELVGLPASEAGKVWSQVYCTLVASPERFKAFNPENGWGDYDGAVHVIGALADACERFPDAKIGGWL